MNLKPLPTTLSCSLLQKMTPGAKQHKQKTSLRAQPVPVKSPGDSDCTRVCQVTHSCQGSFLPLSPRQPNKVEGRSQVKVAGGSSEMAVPSLPSLSPLLTDWMSSGWSGHLLSDQSEFSVDGNCFRTAQEELRRPRAPVGRFNSAADILRFALFRPLIYGRTALDSMFSFIVSISSVWCFTTSP